MRLMIWACTLTSRAETGSSATMRRGLRARASDADALPLSAAKLRGWRWYKHSGRSPTNSSNSATRLRDSERLQRP